MYDAINTLGIDDRFLDLMPRVLGSVKEYLSSDAIDTELHKGGLIKIIKNSFVVFNE